MALVSQCRLWCRVYLLYVLCFCSISWLGFTNCVVTYFFVWFHIKHRCKWKRELLTYLLKMDKNTQFSNFTLFLFPLHHSPCFLLRQLSPLHPSLRYLCLVLSFALRPVDPRADRMYLFVSLQMKYWRPSSDLCIFIWKFVHPAGPPFASRVSFPT
jgi:hypothetical protein